MRNRLKIKFEKVTNSSNNCKTLAVGESFGKPAIKRHNMPFDSFKGVAIPTNIGKAAMGDILELLKAKYPKDWEKRLKQAIEDVDKEANKKRVYLVKTRVVTSRKGYAHQAMKG